MYLVGKFTISKVVPKEFEGRKYFKCTAYGDDKEVYNVTMNYDQQPAVGDVFHMRIEASERDFKPAIRWQREK